MDGWNTRFLLGWPIFRCELLVSGRVTPISSAISPPFIHWFSATCYFLRSKPLCFGLWQNGLFKVESMGAGWGDPTDMDGGGDPRDPLKAGVIKSHPLFWEGNQTMQQMHMFDGNFGGISQKNRIAHCLGWSGIMTPESITYWDTADVTK